jgi:hypothetical protein
MLIARGFLVLCGLSLSVPAMAQQADATFEYSPVARLLKSGQYRAEVWRRDIGADRSEIAWSDSEPAPTAAMAIAEACESLKQSFNPAFHCPHIATPVPREPAAPMAYAAPKVSIAKGPPRPTDPTVGGSKTSTPPPTAPATTPGAPSNDGTWAKNFWKAQERWFGGGGGGDGGGGP